MSDFEHRVENKLDKIDSTLTNHEVILSDIRKDLNYHIKRTDILEETFEHQEEQLKEALIPITWLKMTVKILKWLLPLIATYIAYEQLKNL